MSPGLFWGLYGFLLGFFVCTWVFRKYVRGLRGFKREVLEKESVKPEVKSEVKPVVDRRTLDFEHLASKPEVKSVVDVEVISRVKPVVVEEKPVVRENFDEYY